MDLRAKEKATDLPEKRKARVRDLPEKRKARVRDLPEQADSQRSDSRPCVPISTRASIFAKRLRFMVEAIPAIPACIWATAPDPWS
jgi:hypothetical protein